MTTPAGEGRVEDECREIIDQARRQRFSPTVNMMILKLEARLRAVEGELRNAKRIEGNQDRMVYEASHDRDLWRRELDKAQADAQRLTAERDYWKNQYAEQMDRPCHVIQHEDQEIRLDRLTAEVARLREAAAVMLQECHDDIGGVYSSPGTRLLSAALTPPSPGGAPDA